MHGGSVTNATLAGRNVIGIAVGSGLSYCTLHYFSASNGTTAAVQCSDLPAGGGYLLGQIVYM
jgi:hypothetical protein